MNVLTELSIPFAQRASVVEVRMVQAAFAELMDRCVPVVQSLRLDFDDVVLERFAVMHDEVDAEPNAWVVALPFTGAADDWIRAFDDARRREGTEACSRQGVVFEELRMRVVRVEDPFGGARQG